MKTAHRSNCPGRRGGLISGILLATFLLVVQGHSQIPNAGLEAWVNGNPVGWTTDNVPGLDTPIVPTATILNGQYSLLARVESSNGTIFPPILFCTFPLSQTYTAFEIYNSPALLDGDSLEVYVTISKGVNSIGFGSSASGRGDKTGNIMVVPIDYLSTEAPDSGRIEILIVGPRSSNDTPHVGSSVILANMGFRATTASVTGPDLHSPARFSLDQNFPNPFNPTTVISYSVPSSTGPDGQVSGNSVVRLVVYDVTGREVAVLVNSQEAPGTHEVRFDGSKLASGVYFYRLTAGAFVGIRSMVVMK